MIAWIDAIEANTFHAISRQQIPNNFKAALCEPYRHRWSSEISVQQGMSKLKKKDENSPSEVGSGSKALPKRRKGRAPFVDGKMKQIVPLPKLMKHSNCLKTSSADIGNV